MPKPENVTEHKYKPGDERAVENGRAGGIAGGETKRRKRDMRLALEALLEKDYNIKDPDHQGKTKDVSGAEALALVMMSKALRGDVKAWELVRDTTGQNPKQTHGVSLDIENLVALADLINENEDE